LLDFPRARGFWHPFFQFLRWFFSSSPSNLYSKVWIAPQLSLCPYLLLPILLSIFALFLGLDRFLIACFLGLFCVSLLSFSSPTFDSLAVLACFFCHPDLHPIVFPNLLSDLVLALVSLGFRFFFLIFLLLLLSAFFRPLLQSKMREIVHVQAGMCPLCFFSGFV
jgi:hypothetical protein